MYSLQKCFDIFKREYLDLDPRLQTKTKKAQVTQCLSYSGVGKPLADVPVNVVPPASMHVILGLGKNIYDWLLTLFARLEELEEEKTKGRTTHQFRQAIAGARDNASEYCNYLKREFMDAVDTLEGKRGETANNVKETKQVTSKITTAKIGPQQASWICKLGILKGEIECNKTTPEEKVMYEQIVLHLVIAQGTE